MFGHNENKTNFDAQTFRTLGGFPDYGDYASPFQHHDSFQTLPVENSLEPITWRSTSDGFGGGMLENMGGWAGMPQMPQDDFAMNPKFAMPQLMPQSGRKELHGWNSQLNHVKSLADLSLSDVEPPSAPGGYLEPHCHFFSASPCTVLFQAVQAWLDDQSIDFVVKPLKFQCKCVVYRNGAKLPFYVRVYKTDTLRQYAVEFNRRCGDLIEFTTLYRSATAALAQAGHVLGYQARETPAAQTQLPPLDLESAAGLEEAASGVAQTVGCLVAMASSGFVDLQEQALAALADLTSTDKTVCPAFPAQAVDLLVDSLHSPTCSEDIHRCAVTTLANVVVGQLELCQRLAEQRVVSTLLTLAVAHECSQVARESARALANMAEILNIVAYEPRLRSELPVLKRSADVSVRGYAAALQQRIVA